MGELAGESAWTVAKPQPSNFGFGTNGTPEEQLALIDAEFRQQRAEQPYRIASAIVVPLAPLILLWAFDTYAVIDAFWFSYAALSAVLVVTAIAAHQHDLAALRRDSEAVRARLWDLDGAVARWKQRLFDRTTVKFWLEIGKDLPDRDRGHAFAHEVARLLDAARWPVLVPPKEIDWGIDIVVCAPENAIIQCKHHLNDGNPGTPSSASVRELLGTAAAFDARKGYLVSLQMPSTRPAYGNRHFVKSAGRELEFWHVGHLINIARQLSLTAVGEGAPLDNQARGYFDAQGRPRAWLDDGTEDEPGDN